MPITYSYEGPVVPTAIGVAGTAGYNQGVASARRFSAGLQQQYDQMTQQRFLSAQNRMHDVWTQQAGHQNQMERMGEQGNIQQRLQDSGHQNAMALGAQRHGYSVAEDNNYWAKKKEFDDYTRTADLDDIGRTMEAQTRAKIATLREGVKSGAIDEMQFQREATGVYDEVAKSAEMPLRTKKPGDKQTVWEEPSSGNMIITDADGKYTNLGPRNQTVPEMYERGTIQDKLYPDGSIATIGVDKGVGKKIAGSDPQKGGLPLDIQQRYDALESGAWKDHMTIQAKMYEAQIEGWKANVDPTTMLPVGDMPEPPDLGPRSRMEFRQNWERTMRLDEFQQGGGQGGPQGGPQQQGMSPWEMSLEGQEGPQAQAPQATGNPEVDFAVTALQASEARYAGANPEMTLPREGAPHLLRNRGDFDTIPKDAWYFDPETGKPVQKTVDAHSGQTSVTGVPASERDRGYNIAGKFPKKRLNAKNYMPKTDEQKVFIAQRCPKISHRSQLAGLQSLDWFMIEGTQNVLKVPEGMDGRQFSSLLDMITQLSDEEEEVFE